MKAEKIEYLKRILADGAIIEMVVWKVPDPVPGSNHLYKYRLFFGRNGERIVGFDNERGKGDHCHLDGKEFRYTFVDTKKLKKDFLAEVQRRLKP
ncbi:hypothetical protein GOD17_05330 [Sinorhizobium medicae]|uniref:toxin-antitoxin system TumE family protein n=1 Tax=Sinorhizobium TaxID=28105 RepID=UPI00042691EE|nr:MULTISPECIES: DUF6516 family protein [Sinorhizobium]ARS65986.1 hypothetical protein SMRU11_00680 [Sinorhizobium meliloti RU11/001]MBO1944423.1 hypothetical protein [Sinorhizobium medicae]MDX0594627.1 hypothetical protein [Sinorhizobium medicae]MDX0871008.1 hypothetical protein [Sinorhizobium medicae]